LPANTHITQQQLQLQQQQQLATGSSNINLQLETVQSSSALPRLTAMARIHKSVEILSTLLKNMQMKICF